MTMVSEETARRIADSLERLEQKLDDLCQPSAAMYARYGYLGGPQCRYCLQVHSPSTMCPVTAGGL